MPPGSGARPLLVCPRARRRPVKLEIYRQEARSTGTGSHRYRSNRMIPSRALRPIIGPDGGVHKGGRAPSCAPEPTPQAATPPPPHPPPHKPPPPPHLFLQKPCKSVTSPPLPVSCESVTTTFKPLRANSLQIGRASRRERGAISAVDGASPH